MNFTNLELLAALKSMRLRTTFVSWPEDLQAVMSDPVRARLVRLEATGQRMKRANVNSPSSTRAARWRGVARPKSNTQSVDLKRRAAGDNNE